MIKRYANRKLYDTTDSRYVTLLQIAELVRSGEDVRIIDNRTKEDLTDVTLAQIIYEEQKEGKRTAWSVRTLQRLVREGGDRLMTSLRESPVAKLVARGAEDGEASERTASEPTEPTEPRAGLVARSREAWEELSRSADDRVRALVDTARGQFRELQSEVKRLQARVQELEEKLVRRARDENDGGKSGGGRGPAGGGDPA